jgi:endonuclease YncB( thermonuclease family)
MNLNYRTSRNRWFWSWFVLALLAFGLILRFFHSTLGISDVSGRASVIDGDSLRVSGREVRMQGIDAPEARQFCHGAGGEWACGAAAERQLIQLIGSKEVFCQGVGLDKHGRLLALCKTGDIDLNREMVARGFAVAYGRYYEEERSAKGARRGLWAGEFTMPKVWRRERGIGQ